MMKATVVLRDGTKFETEFDDNRSFTADSLTANTLHTFKSGGMQIFVQGNRISYVIVESKG